MAWRFHFGSALEAAAAIRAKTISSVELTQHTLRRIDAFQPKLNAYVYELRDRALLAAKQADEAIAHNRPTGVFYDRTRTRSFFVYGHLPRKDSLRSISRP